MNKQKFFKLRTDIELSVLKSLLSEGRLYVSSSSEELAIAECVKLMRKAKAMISPEYEKNCERMIETILSISTIKQRMLYKKGKVAGTTNFATFVMVLKYLQCRYVFLCTFSDLLREIFGDDKMKTYTNKSYYMLSGEEESKIKAHLSNFSSKRHK